MRGLRYRNVIVDICSVCHGVWLDGDEIEKVVGRRLPGESAFDLHEVLGTIASFILNLMSLGARLVP